MGLGRKDGERGARLRRRSLALVASLGLALLATQCGGGVPSSGGGGTTISVAISPTSATLNAGATQQFTATVTGTSDTAVNWSATAGTVTATGLYTAPNPAPASGAATVTAASQADTAAAASAKVTISASTTSCTFPFTNPVTVTAGQKTTGVDVAVPTLTPTLLITAVGVGNSAGAATVPVAQGSSASLLIVGEGMVAGTCYAVSGPNDVGVTQPGSGSFFMCGPSGGAKNIPCAQVNISVTSAAALGARNILVKNGAGEVSAFVGGLLITKGP